MLRRRHKRALAVLALSLAACRSPAPSLAPPVQAVTLRLHATETTIDLLRELTQEYQASRPDIRILAHLSIVAHDEALSTAHADTAAYTLVDYLPSEAPHWAIPLGYDQLAILAAPDTEVTALTLSELRAVLTGSVTNWRDLGGADLPISVVSMETGSSPQQALQDLVLGQRQLTRTARLAPSQAALLRILSETPGAIGHSMRSTAQPANLVTLAVDGQRPDLAQDSAYALTAPLYVIGPGEPQGILRDFLAWTQSEAGQTIVARRYIPAFLELPEISELPLFERVIIDGVVHEAM